MDRERILWLYGYKAFHFAILRDRLVCPVCGSRPRPDPAFWRHPNLGGMRFYCWWCDACIYTELERGRRWGFVIEWVPCSGGDARRFWLSLFVLRLHDAGQLPLGYLETSFWGGVIREVIPPPPPGFLARLKRFLRRRIMGPAVSEITR
jgi:hypothetical protein